MANKIGLLLGFIADEIIVTTESSNKKLNQIIVGIYDKYISKNGAYTGLIGLDIIETCEENEHFSNNKRYYKHNICKIYK